MANGAIQQIHEPSCRLAGVERVKAAFASAERVRVMHRATTSRWEGSEVTFGPVGRVGVTILLFVPVWFGVFYSVFFLVAAAIWMFILPMALHQIWQPVRTCDETAWPLLGPDPTQPTVPAEPAALAPGESLLERSAPSRW